MLNSVDIGTKYIAIIGQWTLQSPKIIGIWYVFVFFCKTLNKCMNLHGPSINYQDIKLQIKSKFWWDFWFLYTLIAFSILSILCFIIIKYYFGYHNMFLSWFHLLFLGSQDDYPRQREEAAWLLPNGRTSFRSWGREVDGSRTMDSIRPKRGTTKPVCSWCHRKCETLCFD